MCAVMNEKIVTREEAATLRGACRAQGKRVGFTSGVFDILHPGHVAYLEQAKALVDILIVGLNSDSSVRANKGNSRPINAEQERAQVIAGLASVDHVFVFSERNNNTNVELLKPDLYIKAGDYSPEKLSSKQLVESYGGQVALVPFVEGRSTTGVIEKIQAAHISQEGPAVAYELRPAVFLDRDGTINEHIEYLSDPHGFAPIPGAFAAIKRLRDLGYRIVIITNQPGIGLGYFSKEDLYAVNREMMRLASSEGCSFDKIYFCPHSKADGCSCRKPKPYFIERATQELNIDLANSFVIGDMTSDVMLGQNAGVRTILVQTGRGGSDGIFQVTATHVAKNLADAAAWIEQQPKLPSVATKESRAEVATSTQAPAVAPVLASGLSRDLATILGSILGGATLIEQRTSADGHTSTIGEPLALIRKAANRGLAISKKLDLFARGSEASMAKHSIKSCIETVIELVSSTHGDECSFEVVCPEDLEVEMADVTVAQMLLELCENSLESMRALPERFILFHVDRVALDADAKGLELAPGSYARVSIIDHGDGIDEEQRTAVFKSVSSSKVKEFDHDLGQSMLMAKSVMKQHGGTVAVASRRQAGTNISLYFPLVA